MEVQTIMTRELNTVTPDQAVGDLYRLFESVTYHHLPVLKDDKLVGIVSDRDVLRAVSPFMDTEAERAEDSALMQRKVSDIMSTELVTASESASIDFASILLLENNISCLPVLDDSGKFVGLLTWKDILRFHIYEPKT